MKKCYTCFKDYSGSVSVCPYCGQPEITKAKEPIHLAPGTVLAGRYILGLAVGAGGFGIVYRAWDMKLETVVAVKEFFVSRLITRAEGLINVIVNKKSKEEFEYRKDRFLAEARNMAKFGQHRSIPNVFELFEENNTAYIVMELLHGIALNEYLNQHNGKIDIDFALMIANEVGNALQSLHNEGIIHRDVAPDNIYICSGKEIRIKLMDLGAAKLADSTDEVVDIILKPGYSPPEQYDNSKNIGPWTDIYALGATLYAMLTGVKPDESTNRKINDEVVPPNQLNPLIRENLSNTILKAMAIDRHMRFKNVAEFLSAINGDRKVVTLAQERKLRGRKRFLGITAAVLAVSICAGVVLNTYAKRKAAEDLKPATISVWYSVEDGSTEEDAMLLVGSHFKENFEDVTLELRAIPADEYADILYSAAASNTLPNLFESTDLPDGFLNNARSLSNVIASEQFAQSAFLKQYHNYYNDDKRMPLGIEVPIAYVITKGAACIDYTGKYFMDLSDFGEGINISADGEHSAMLKSNYGTSSFSSSDEFFNNQANTSPVMLSSTMLINEVRTKLTNYEKSYVFYGADEIYCDFTYEWSIGQGSEEQVAATEKLLSWMLGNVYQSYLMISKCNDGQIPVNGICFESKIEAKNLTPIAEIYNSFIFEGRDD